MLMKQEASNFDSSKITKAHITYQPKSKLILQKALQFSGLKLIQEIDYTPIKIYEIDHIHEIYTNNLETSLPHIVLLHGFGGTAMTYIRFFKNLKQYYKVHAIDALGVGHSSKGVFKNDFKYEEARHYFIDAVEQWRKARNIQNFTLVGHSFGGYLAACYTQTYPERVHRLIMLSPAGATQRTPQQIKQQVKKRYKNDGMRGKFMNYFAQSIYNLKISPSKLMSSWIIGDRLIDRIIDVRFKLKLEQRQAWKSYFKDLSSREAVSQAGFYIIFEWPLKPKHTIQAMVKRMNFNKPIEFYYGQHDWMDSEGAKKLSQCCQNVKFNLITEADHQLIFDNPDEVCYMILLRRTIGQLSHEYRRQSKQKININNQSSQS